jgi:signal transduction histidine kinase
MKRFLLLSLVCFFTIDAAGQTPQIDSLKHIVYASKNDLEKLKATLNLCGRFETLPKDTLWKYAISAKILSNRLKDTHSASLALIAQANAYLRWNNTDSARAMVESELSKYKAQNPAARDIYFQLRNLKINCIGSASDYKNAIAESYSVIREAEKYKDSLAIATSLNYLSGYKYEMDFPAQAISYGIKGLSFTSNTPRYTTAIINLCGNLAEYYYWINKLDSATYYDRRTLKLSRQAGYANFQSWALQKMSAIYVKKKDYRNAQKAILESIKLDGLVDGTEPHDDNLIALADVYERTGQFDKAIKAITDGLGYYSVAKNISPHAKNSTGADGLQRIFLYQSLAKCYRLKGDSKNYEAILEKIIADMDAFYKANSARAIADFDVKYQVQKMDATIARQQLALVREHYLYYDSVAVASMAGIIVILIFREARRKQKVKLQRQRTEERLLSERAIAEAEESERRRIAADLHDNLGAQLSFIKRNVNFVMDQPAGFSREDERKYLLSVNDIAQNAMIDLRETIWVLNKDEVNIQEFADKLKSYLRQQLMSKDSIRWDFQERISENWKLSSGEVMHLFRIVQEVINNIVKHAEAEQINIQFNSSGPNSYELEIVDNGKGFDVNGKYSGHYGLENIGQRAKEIFASLSIASGPAGGTQIHLQKG